jgi:hypothetical protein
MSTDEASDIITCISPARLRAAFALDADQSKDWSAIPAADRDIITAANWDHETQQIAASKLAVVPL